MTGCEIVKVFHHVQAENDRLCRQRMTGCEVVKVIHYVQAENNRL